MKTTRHELRERYERFCKNFDICTECPYAECSGYCTMVFGYDYAKAEEDRKHQCNHDCDAIWDAYANGRSDAMDEIIAYLTAEEEKYLDRMESLIGAVFRTARFKAEKMKERKNE